MATGVGCSDPVPTTVDHNDHDLEDPSGGAGGESSGASDDQDRDGYTVSEGDCDDLNRTVHPGAEEVSGDGLNSDCDPDDQDLPAMELVWSAAKGAKNVVDAVAKLDSDGDGLISLAEFATGCEKSSLLSEKGAPGIVQVHASCAGTNSCRGMVYQTWNELYEHSCRGVNGCSGWSCVALAADGKRTAEQAWDAGHCGYCHSPYDDAGEPIPGVFQVPVHEGADEAETVANFWTSRSQDALRAAIAFGIDGMTDDGLAYSNMPGAHTVLSLRETDALIDYIQEMELKAHPISVPPEAEKPE
jgi:hypothetical protein